VTVDIRETQKLIGLDALLSLDIQDELERNILSWSFWTPQKLDTFI